MVGGRTADAGGGASGEAPHGGQVARVDRARLCGGGGLRQVGGYEPAVVSLAPSEPAPPPSRPLEAETPPVATWGAASPNDTGAPSAMADAGAKVAPTERKRSPGRRAPREVFRKPGF